jgi:hypothetical protein
MKQRPYSRAIFGFNFERDAWNSLQYRNVPTVVIVIISIYFCVSYQISACVQVVRSLKSDLESG